MARPKLSKQQRNRIQLNQQQRALANHQDQPLLQAVVLAHHGNKLLLEYEQQMIEAIPRASLASLSTGDRVMFWLDAQGQGIIEHLQPRTSILTRPDNRGKLKAVAANIDVIVIVACPDPETPENLIDRYLVAAKVADIPAMLVLNKAELASAKDWQTCLDYYQQHLGLTTIKTSIHKPDSITRLSQALAGKTAILVGQSGVGKSSLLQALMPSQDIRTGAISEATGKGKHTTTTTRLYHGPHQNTIIDSPGVRDFGLWNASADQVKAAFTDIDQLAAQCRFNNCSHQHEPGCAVKAALSHRLPLKRLNSYFNIIQSLDQISVYD